MGLDARLLGDRQGLGVVLVDGGLAAAMLLGILSLGECHKADEEIGRLKAGGGDEIDLGAAHLKAVLWNTYNDALCDIVDSSKDGGDPFKAFDSRKAEIERFMEVQVQRNRMEQFKSEVDAYGANDA